MIEIVIAFLAGCLWTRLYYARTKTTDKWGSTDWFKGTWWKELHKVFCWSCPKRHYCERGMNGITHISNGINT